MPNMLKFKVPEYDKAKHGQHMITLEWCFDGPNNVLGYVQVTPMTFGYIELAQEYHFIGQSAVVYRCGL